MLKNIKDNIKVLQINVRLTEGGAAQVALALHCNLYKYNIKSIFYYGYSKDINNNKFEKDYESVKRITGKFEVILRFLVNRLLGIEPSFIFQNSLKKISYIINKVNIIHLHVLHSYYIDYEKLINLLCLKKKVIWTLHDHWITTGRCAFTDGCEYWKDGCGNCITKNNYPPSYFDISKINLERKKFLLSVYSNNIIFVSPSKHLANDILVNHPLINVKVIPNSISNEIQKIIFSKKDNIEKLPLINKDFIKILIVANDLSYSGKTNRNIVNAIANNINGEIITIGKNSPFKSSKFTNLGEISNKEILIDNYLNCDVLLFTSEVDNFPLVMCEALCCGLPIVALKSSASDEILSYVGAKSINKDELMKFDNSFNIQLLYQGTKTRKDLSDLALSKFDYNLMIDNYAKLYNEVLDESNYS